MLAVPLDEFDEIGREFGKVGQCFMDHHRIGSRGSRRRASRRALTRNPLALHQKDGLIVFAGQDGVIAFDEHDGWSIRAERAACNIIIAQLETTHYTHNKPDSMGLLFKNPIRMGEDESGWKSGLDSTAICRGRGYAGAGSKPRGMNIQHPTSSRKEE